MDKNFEILRDISASEQRRRTNEKLESLEKELKRLRKKSNNATRCPYCDGELSRTGVEICKHCRSKLVWFHHFPAKVGQLAEAEKKYASFLAEANERKAKEAELEAANNERIAPLIKEIIRLEKLGKGLRPYYFYHLVAIVGCFAVGLPAGSAAITFFAIFLIFPCSLWIPISYTINQYSINKLGAEI